MHDATAFEILLIVDLNNKICCYVKFNPDKVGLFEGLFKKKKKIDSKYNIGDFVSFHYKNDLRAYHMDNHHHH